MAVTVTATYVDAAGTAASGSVEFRPVRSAGNGTDLVVPLPVSATLDESGQISVDLTSSDDTGWVAPAGQVRYQVRELIDGLPERTYVADLDGTSVDLADVQPA